MRAYFEHMQVIFSLYVLFYSTVLIRYCNHTCKVLEASWRFYSNFSKTTMGMTYLENTWIDSFVNLKNISCLIFLHHFSNDRLPYPCGLDKMLGLLRENFLFLLSVVFLVGEHEPKVYPSDRYIYYIQRNCANSHLKIVN